ncbi:reverse transcriptase/maturase family protein [Clostridium putrefaciens]|uniref:Reverse transcriptase/maturase family protein n=1 Tax=Clostridium putrefaciens TaxID=99675 RepID=A0A381JC26_9CLOT|nr:hypothetical protein [Clostridium putrefaciens]SUY48543.1 reverse transcriptase/maturase family protein [Clostridium putrefaciens]
MQKADMILSILSKKPIEFKVNRIYRQLFNLDFYYGVIDEIIKRNAFKMYIIKEDVDINKLVEDIIFKLKTERYKPIDLRCIINNKYIYLLKSTDISRFKEDALLNMYIDEGAIEDYILQKVLKQVLDNIYISNLNKYEFFKILDKKEVVISYLKSIRHIYYYKVVKINLNNMFHVKQMETLKGIINFKIDDGRFNVLIDLFIKSNYLRFYEIVKSDDLYYMYMDKDNHLSASFYKLYFLKIRDIVEELINSKKVNVSTVCYYDEALLMIRPGGDVKGFLQDLNYRLKEFKYINIEEYELKDSNNIEFFNYNIRFRNKESFTKILVSSKVMNASIHNFKKENRPSYIGKRINLKREDIISLYTLEIDYMYEYYKYAEDVNYKMRRFRYYHKNSMISTIALKENISIRAVKDRYIKGYKVSHQEGYNEEDKTPYLNKRLKVQKI